MPLLEGTRGGISVSSQHLKKLYLSLAITFLKKFFIDAMRRANDLLPLFRPTKSSKLNFQQRLQVGNFP